MVVMPALQLKMCSNLSPPYERETGTALMLTIFALQDSFGTACNVTGDGALTLFLTGFAEKHNIEEADLGDVLG